MGSVISKFSIICAGAQVYLERCAVILYLNFSPMAIFEHCFYPLPELCLNTILRKRCNQVSHSPLAIDD